MSAPSSSATLPGLAKGPGCSASVELIAPTIRSTSALVGGDHGNLHPGGSSRPQYPNKSNCWGL